MTMARFELAKLSQWILSPPPLTTREHCLMLSAPAGFEPATTRLTVVCSAN